MSIGRETARDGSGTPAVPGEQAGASAWRFVLWAGLLLAFGWAYANTGIELWKDWQRDANYSVGQIVPLLAAYLIWRDRRGLRRSVRRPNWWGGALLGAGLFCQVVGLALLYNSIERYSLVVSLAGLVLLVLGWTAAWRLRWVFAFLLLMVPLPGRVHNAISAPLQSASTAGTVAVLEMLGNDVDREGNILLVNEGEPLGVAESCSGLRMLTAFVVIAAMAAFLVDGPRWWRVVLMLASVPIAIVCNVVRLSVTAGLSTRVDTRTLETFVHDFAGLAMMPVAVAMLFGVTALLNQLDTREPATKRT